MGLAGPISAETASTAFSQLVLRGTLPGPLVPSLSGLRGRIALFGGTFDPIHAGHLAVAEAARVERNLDFVILVPAGQNPLKSKAPASSGELRLQMICAALLGRAGLGVSPAQLRGDVDNYTVTLLRAVRRQSPDAELFLVIGSDCLSDLEKWREVEEVLRLAVPIVAEREGYPPAHEAIIASRLSLEAKTKLLHGVLKTQIKGTSSTRIREALARDEACVDMTLPEIRPYLES